MSESLPSPSSPFLATGRHLRKRLAITTVTFPPSAIRTSRLTRSDREPKRHCGTSDTSEEIKTPKDGDDGEVGVKASFGSSLGQRPKNVRSYSPFGSGWNKPKEERDKGKGRPASRSSFRPSTTDATADGPETKPSITPQPNGDWTCGWCTSFNPASATTTCILCEAAKPTAPSAACSSTATGTSTNPSVQRSGEGSVASLPSTTMNQSTAGRAISTSATGSHFSGRERRPRIFTPRQLLYHPALDRSRTPYSDDDIENKPPIKSEPHLNNSGESSRQIRPSSSWASVTSIPQGSPQQRTRKEATPYPLPTEEEPLDTLFHAPDDTPSPPASTDMDDSDGLDESDDEDIIGGTSQSEPTSTDDDDMNSDSTSVASDETCTCANCTWQRGDSTLFRSRPESRLDDPVNDMRGDEEAFGEAITRIRARAGLDDSAMDVGDLAATGEGTQASEATKGNIPTGTARELPGSLTAVIRKLNDTLDGLPADDFVEEAAPNSRATSSTLRDHPNNGQALISAEEAAINDAANSDVQRRLDKGKQRGDDESGTSATSNLSANQENTATPSATAQAQAASSLAESDITAVLAALKAQVTSNSDITAALTALQAQATAQAASHAAFTTAISSITDQVARLAETIKNVSQRQDEQAAAEERRRLKVEEIGTTVEEIVAHTDKMGKMVESITTEVAEQKNNQNRPRPVDILGGGRDVGAQLDGMDEAILGLENKVIGLGKFLTGKVVRGADSITENGLQAQFDIINNRLNIQDELMDDLAGDAGGANEAATDALERIYVIEEALGTSTIPAPASSVLGQLKAIQERLERNFKY